MPHMSRMTLRVFLASTLMLSLVALMLVPAAGQPGKDGKDGLNLVQTLKGHKDAVFSLAFTPDGKYVITGSFDSTLKMWDLATGQEVRTFAGAAGHTKGVNCAAISKDGQYLLSGGGDNTLKIWDVPSSTPLREFAAKEAINAVALTADGKKLATALKDGSIKVWNTDDGKELLTLKGHPGAVTSVAFSANAATIASCDDKGIVRFWNAANGQPTSEIGAHTGPANGIAVNPNNATAYSVGQDGTLRFWALATPLPRPFPAHAQALTTLALSPDGNQVLAASADKVAKVSNFANGQQLRLLADVPAPVTSAAFNSNATQVAGGTQAGQLVLWNNTDGKVVAQAQGSDAAITGVSIKPQNDQAITVAADGSLRVWTLPLPASKSLAHPDEVLTAAWKTDGTKVYTGSKDKIVRAWLLQNNTVEKQFAGHTAPVTAVALSPNGAVLASGSDDSTIRLWNPADGKETAVLGAHGARVTSLAFTAAGTQLVSASADGTVKLWNVPPPAPKSLAHPDQVTSLALTPDGAKLVTGGADKIVRVWNIATAAKEKDLPGFTMPVSAVAVSGNGQVVAGGSADKNLIVWTMADGKEVKKITTPAAITAVALNQDGKTVASGEGNAIRLVNVADGMELKQFAGHTGPISGVIWSTKGDQVISASADKTVKVWDIANGMAKTTLQHAGPVTSLALSKDGVHVAAAAARSIKVWKLDDGKEVANITTRGDVRSLSFAPTGQIVAAGEADNATRLYGLDGKLQQFIAHPAAVNAVVFHNDGKQVITAGADKQAQVWTSPLVWQQNQAGPVQQVLFNGKTNQVLVAGAEKEIKAYNIADGKEAKGIPTGDAVVSLALTGDGSKLVSTGADKSVKVWNLTTLDKDKDIKPLATWALKGAAQSVSISPDGNRVAIAVAEDKANAIRILDAATGKELQSFRDHKGAISSLAFHTDNKTLLSAGTDKSARLDVLGVVAHLDAHPGGASAVQYHGNGTQAISAGADKTVKLWDLTKMTVLKTLGPVEDPVSQAVFNKDYTQIGTVAGKSARIWNVADGKELAKFDHPARVTSISFNGDKSRIVTCCEDKQTRVWDVATKKVLEFFPQEDAAAQAIFHTGNTSVVLGSGKTVSVDTLGIQRLVAASDQPLHAVVAVANATHVLTGGADKSVKLWNVTNGNAERTFAGAGAAVQAVAISPNSQLVAVGGADKTLRVYTFADAKEVKSDAAPGPIQSLRFSPNNLVLLGTCAKDTVMAWDTTFTPGQPVPEGFLKTVQVFHHGDLPTDVVMGPDNATLYSGSLDKTARAWRLAAAAPKANLPHPGTVLAVVLSPDGKLFASASTDGKVRVYDFDKKTLVKEINAHPTKDQTQVYALAFSPDSKTIASGGMDKIITIHDALSGNLVRDIKGYKAKESEDGHKDTINALAFTSDGKTLASGSAGLERVIKLWTTADGKLQRVLDNPPIKDKFRKDPQSIPGWIQGVQFTKDGKYLIASGFAKPFNKGYLGIWKTADGALVSGQELPLGVFYGLALSADESMVAIGAGNLAPVAKVQPQFNAGYLFKLPPLP